jgi:hypothetical protein
MSIPEPSAPQPKKGLPPLAWAGIGCAAFLLILLVAGGMVFAFVFKKAKSAVEELEKNPAKGAEMLIKMHPDLELLSTDEGAKMITFREKSSGQVSTVSFEDIRSGKFSITTGTQSFHFDAGTEGTVSVKSNDGEHSLQGGSFDVEKLPDWVRTLLPETFTPTGNSFATETPQDVMGSATFEVPEPLPALSASFKGKLEEAGFAVTDTWMTADNEKPVATVQGTREAEKETFSAILTPAEKAGTSEATTVVITYKGAKR